MHHAAEPLDPSTPPTSRATLAALASTYAGASRVFQRFHLDFCCRGQQTVAAACAERGVDPEQVLAELAAVTAPVSAAESWAKRPTADLVKHVLDRYHAAHRSELPRLLQMARKVEAVHGDRPECPRGLAAHVERLGAALEEHMRKEELVLFPMLLAGAEVSLRDPIRTIEAEHLEHGQNLETMRALAHDYVPPAGACGTWRALYLGLAELEREVMEHVHLENHVLFPRVGIAAA